MNLKSSLKEYIDTNPRLASVQSARRYWTMLNNFERHLGRDAEPSDLTDAIYGRWINTRRKEGRLAAGTIRGEAEKLLVLWRWIAKREGLTPPNVVLPSPSETSPSTWRVKDIERLDKTARHCDWWIGGIPAKLFWPAMIGVAVDTGERLGAIHALRPDDIDIANRVVTFRRETRKGQRKDSRKLISKRTARDVRALIAGHPLAPFAPVKPASLYQPMRRLLVEAGLSSGRNNMFHNFRRYHATQVTIQGGDAAASLGHCDPRVTRRHYIDAAQLPAMLPRRARSWLARLWAR